MPLYPLLFLAFLFQEPISSNGILLEAYQHHYNVWIIHLLFIIATLIDATLFYYFGSVFHKKFSHSKVVRYVKEKSESFFRFAGKYGTRIALVVYGPILFPLSAFITPWLGISFLDSLIFLFIGDLVFWYGGEWLIVLGVKSLIPNPKLALIATLSLSFLIFVLVKRYFAKPRS